ERAQAQPFGAEAERGHDAEACCEKPGGDPDLGAARERARQLRVRECELEPASRDGADRKDGCRALVEGEDDDDGEGREQKNDEGPVVDRQRGAPDAAENRHRAASGAWARRSVSRKRPKTTVSTMTTAISASAST